MNSAYLSAFVQDDQFTAVALLIVLDLVMGIAAAFYTKTFALTFVANFMRNDVLGKVVPWFVLFAAGMASHSADIVFGIDMETIADGVFIGVAAALVGSLATSLSDFGVALPSPLGRRTG